MIYKNILKGLNNKNVQHLLIKTKINKMEMIRIIEE